MKKNCLILVLLLLSNFLFAQIPTDECVEIEINSGNPSFPYPQFLEYKEGKTLAKYNAEGVTHADMEKTGREAYEIMSHRCRYQDGTHCGVPYIVFNPEEVPHYGAEPICSEGDGYMLLASAIFADQPTFNGLWMRIHDHKLSRVVKYKDCKELRPDMKSPGYMTGWQDNCTENTPANEGACHSATDGDVDIAMALLIAYKQWGEFMYHKGKQVIDNCGNPISYKEAAQKAIKALVDTVPDYMDNGAFAGYMSGDIGIDGYVKSGNTWGELTQWRTNQTDYPWAQAKPTLGGNYGAHYFDYNAPSYFNEFAHWLENEDGEGNDWQINQLKRAEASSDFLMGEAYNQGNIASIGKVFCENTDGVFTFGPFNSGEDFRASWRTILNYLWHGNPTYTWNPVTHQVENGGNTFEYDMAVRHAEYLKSPRLNGAQKCKKMGASPDPGQPMWWGVAQIPQAWNQTGEEELDRSGSNYALGTGAPAAVASEDLELISDMYRQSELVWDDASTESKTLTDDERYILSTPKYFHGMFRILGLLTNSGNMHAPRDMVPAANVKVYMSVDKTYAYQEDMLKYTIQYRNFGSKQAEGVSITTPLDPDYAFVSANNGGKYNSGDHSITWEIGAIPGFKTGGLNATIDSVSFLVHITDTINSRVCLTSTVSGNNFEDWVSNEYPNNASYTMERNCVDILANRTLKVSKKANRNKMNPNDIVKFTVDFENESSDDSWLNGGRSNVYLSYSNYLPNITSNGDWDNTSFYQFYRFWNDGAEAYINMNNYRFSYFLNDINKGFKSAENPNGWLFSVDNQNDLDKYGYNPANGPITFAYQKVPAGQDQFGSWNQRIMIQFAKTLMGTSTHVYDKLDSKYLLHKGVFGPGFIRSRLYTDPATNMKDKVSDDWSYDVKLQNTAEQGDPLSAQASLLFPVSPVWSEYDNLGFELNNYARHSCSPDVDNFDRVLVEEFDGYTWRRIQGRGPLPGKEAYKVTIVDTIPKYLSWKGFLDDEALDIQAEYIPAPPGSDYTGVVKWMIPEMLVGEKGNLVYEAIAVDINCPSDDVFFENAAWIYSDTDSPDSSKVDLMITCAELPPVIDPQTSLFKRSSVSKAEVGDIITYELEYKNTEGTKVVGDLSTQNEWIKLGNGNIPLATGTFSCDQNKNTGISPPYFFANERSYGVNGELETTWDVGNDSKFYVVFRYTSGTPYEADFKGVCLRVTPIPAGQGTIKFELIDGTKTIATETSNVSYPTDDQGNFNPINLKFKLQDEKIYVYVNDYETVLKSYSGLTTLTEGYAGIYSGPSGNQQTMIALSTAFDYAFDVTVFDQLPDDLGKIADVSDGGSWNNTTNEITWPTVAGPIAYNESIIYTYDAEVVSCNNFITNLGQATVYGMDTLKVLNVVECGKPCETPTKIAIVSNLTVCENEETEFEIDVFPSGTWSYAISGDTAIWHEQKETSPFVLPAGNYTIIAADPTDTAGCTYSEDFEIVEISPAPPETKDTVLALSSDPIPDLEATGNAGAAFTWYNEAGAAKEANPFTTGQTANGTYVYTVTQTVDGCESQPDTAVLVITDCPELPPAVTRDTICLGSATHYLLKYTGTGSAWFEDGASIEDGNVVETASSYPLALDKGAGMYSMQVAKKGAKCWSEPSEAWVYVADTPSPAVSAEPSYCWTDEAPLAVSPSGGELYVNGNLADEFIPADLTAGKYELEYRVSESGCTGTASAATEIIKPKAPAVSSPYIIPIFELGDKNTISAAGSGDIFWAGDGFSKQGSDVEHGLTSAGTYTFYAWQEIDGCQGDSSELVVEVTDCGTPAPSVSPLMITACQNSAPGTFTASLSGTATKLIWRDSTNSEISSGETFTPEMLSPGTYKWKVSQVDGCEGPAAEAVLIVSALPKVGLVPDTTLCIGAGSAQIGAYPSNATLILDKKVQTGLEIPLSPDLLLPGTHELMLTATEGNCSADTTVTFTAIAIEAPVAKSLTEFIDTAHFVLTASAEGTIYWQDGTGTPLGTGEEYIHSPQDNAGSWLYGVHAENYGCKSDTTWINYQLTDCDVEPPIVPEKVNACGGVEAPQIEAKGVDGATIKWYNLNISVDNPIATGITFRPGVLEPGVNVFGVSQETYCESSAFTVMFYVSKFNEPVPIVPQDICAGTKALLTIKNPEGIVQWTSDTLIGVEYEGATFEISAEAGENKVFVREKFDNCPGPWSDASFNAFAIPSAPVVDPLPICSGQDAIFTAIGEANSVITWHKAINGPVDDSGETYTVLQPPVGKTLYFVRQEVDGCFSDFAEAIIDVMDEPNPPLAQDASYCAGDSPAALTASGPSGAEIRWYSDRQGSNQLGTGSPYTPSGAGRYYAAVWLDGCMSNTAPADLTEIPLQQSLLIGVPPQVCMSDLPLAITSNSENTIWGVGSAPSGTPSLSHDFNQSAAGLYTIKTAIDEGGCTGPVTETRVEVLDAPSPPDFINVPDSICAGELGTFSANVNAGETINWYVDGNLVGTGSELDRSSVIALMIEGEYTVSARALIGAGCMSTPQEEPVTVIKAPGEPIVANEWSCYGEGIRPLMAIGKPGLTYEWKDISGSVLGTGFSYTPPVSDEGEYTYMVQASNGMCTGAVAVGKYSVYPVPQVEIFGDSTVCASDRRDELYSIEGSFLNVSWEFSEDATVTWVEEADPMRRLVRFASAGMHSIHVRVESQGGCYAGDSMTVIAAPKPEVGLAVEVYDEGKNVYFINTTVADSIATGEESAVPEYLWIWDLGNGREAFAYDGDTVRQGIQPGVYNALLRATGSDYGCEAYASAEYEVFISHGLAVPTAICPSAGGLGVREFRPQGMNLAECKLFIYDTWGNLVFYGDQVKDGEFISVWDGRDSNGDLLKADTYIWKIDATFIDGTEWKGQKAKNGRVSTFGSVLLIR